MGGVALLVLVGMLIERNTITDTKRVRQTLEAVAAGLKVKQSGYGLCVYRAGARWRRYTWNKRIVPWTLREFHEFSIRNLNVRVNYRTSPHTAEAKFTVVLRGKAHAMARLTAEPWP